MDELVASRKVDSFVQALSGMGQAGQDKSVDVHYENTKCLGPQELHDLYSSNWLARRVVQKDLQIAISGGFKIKGKDDSAEIIERFNTFNTRQCKEGALHSAICMGRLIGWGGLLLGYKSGGSLERPPRSTAVLDWVDFIPGDQLEADRRYDEEHDKANENFRYPKTYVVTGNHRRAGLRFHESRFVRFNGLGGQTYGSYGRGGGTMTDPEKGLSVLQPVFAEISRYGLAWQGVTNLLQEASISSLTLSGLIAAINSERQAELELRAELLSRGKSMLRTMFLDADNDESFQRHAVSFADVPDVLRELMATISGAIDTPAVVLWGSAGGGLGNSGEMELQNYYRRIRHFQITVLKPALETVIRALENDDSLEVVFPPLWEPGIQEAAQARATEVGSIMTVLKAGLITKEEARKAISEGAELKEVIDSALPKELDTPVVPEESQSEAPGPFQPDDPGSNRGNEQGAQVDPAPQLEESSE